MIGTPYCSKATKAVLLGSGELGKEIAIELQRLGVEVIAVDRYEHAPAMHIAHKSYVIDMLNDQALEQLLNEIKPDYVIPEIEAIATNTLVKLEQQGMHIVPCSQATLITMDREKIRTLSAETLGLKTSKYVFADSQEEFEAGVKKIGIPCVVKPVMSSSGKGQSVIKDESQILAAWKYAHEEGRGKKNKVIIEEFLKFDYEITQLTVNAVDGIHFCEPIGHRQEDGDYRESWQPRQMPEQIKKKAQEIAEKKVREWKTPEDPKLDIGYMMMDFEGRVLATVGGRQEKDGRLLWDNASRSSLQPGSTIKPLASFAPAIDSKKINFSSLVDDSPVPYFYGDESGPKNWYQTYYGKITATRALTISSNAATLSVLNMVGKENSYNFLTQCLNFKHLDEENDKDNIAGLALGGFTGGATVEEMTAAYNIFSNGGYYYEPYTYYYVTDTDGNVILDNRDRGKPDQIISTETSTIMNRMLSDVVNSGEEALGYRAKIDGWDIIGKTGTTDASFDNWFVGASPYATAGIWTGHKKPAAIAEKEQNAVHVLWHDIMEEWLKGKPSKTYTLGGEVEQHNYIKSTGLITNYSGGDKIATGYYTADNMPGYDYNDPYAKPKPQQTSRDESSTDDDDDDDDDNWDDWDDDDDDEDEDDDDEPEESSEDESSEEEESSQQPEPEPEPEPSEEPQASETHEEPSPAPQASSQQSGT